MAKRDLPVVEPGAEGLGAETVMSRELARTHGTLYVHFVAFAIDVDRVREALETTPAELPAGWEVLLTEEWMLAHLDPGEASQRAILEDTCAHVIEASLASAQDLLGGQIPFAAYDAVKRGAWPSDLASMFAAWRRGPDDLVAESRAPARRRGARPGPRPGVPRSAREAAARAADARRAPRLVEASSATVPCSRRPAGELLRSLSRGALLLRPRAAVAPSRR